MLGEGAFGLVYEALHKPSGLKVAVKKARKEGDKISLEVKFLCMF